MRLPLTCRHCGIVLLLLLAAALLPALPTHADTQSLFGRSAAFADMLYSDDPVLTLDNRFVLFRADLETDGVYNLYRVPITGGQPAKLSGAVLAGKGVRHFALSPDGARVVYTSSQAVENRDELYSVPIAGGPPVKLSGALPTGGNVDSFQMDDDSSLMVYKADQESNDVFELYRVPITGGASVKLNAPLVAGGDVLDDYGISANAQFVVYRADQEVNNRDELYSVPLAGGTVEKLNGTLASGGQVDYFYLSPVLNIAVYVARQASTYELYSVQLNGNPIGKLNGAIPTGQRATYFNITPDGQRVVYVIGKGFFSDAEGILYSVSIFGGASTQLSPSPNAGGDVVFRRLSADSTYVVFGFKPKADAALTLYSAALDTGMRATLYNVALNHGLRGLDLSPDSGWVIFSDDDEATPPQNNGVIIYAVPLRGGAVVQLSQNGENGINPVISPKSDRVLFHSYISNSATCSEGNLYTVQIFGGDRRALSDLCGTGGGLGDVQWSGDASRIIYSVSYDDGHAGFELFVSDGQPILPTPTPLPTVLAEPTPTATPTQTEPTPTPPAQAPANRIYAPLLQR